MGDTTIARSGRSIALGAGLGMICGFALGNAAFGLVLGAAAGVAAGRLGRGGSDRTGGNPR